MSLLWKLALVVALLAAWFGWKVYEERQPVVRDYFGEKWEFGEKVSLPKCHFPRVYRNAVHFGDHEGCKTGDECTEFFTDRLLHFWADEEMAALPPEHRSDHSTNQQYNHTVYLSMADYLNSPKYASHVVHSLAQLGTAAQYRAFLQFDEQSPDNFHSSISRVKEHAYFGSQLFISRGSTGSALHYAIANNIFLMLAGRKRWLLVDPAYLPDVGCRMGITGMYGSCSPDGYNPQYGAIDIEMYKRLFVKLGIPAHAVLDVTLKPGDVLLNCPIWVHTIANESPFTLAFSVRNLAEPHYKVYRPSLIMQGALGFAQAVYTKLFRSSSAFTILDGAFKKKLTVTIGMFTYVT